MGDSYSLSAANGGESEYCYDRKGNRQSQTLQAMKRVRRAPLAAVTWACTLSMRSGSFARYRRTAAADTVLLPHLRVLEPPVSAASGCAQRILQNPMRTYQEVAAT